MTLADVTGVLDTIFTGTCDLQRAAVGARDGFGNAAITWATIKQGVPASLQPSVSFSRWFEENQQNQNFVGDSILFIKRDPSYTPRHRDRIVNYSVENNDCQVFTDSTTYEIRAVLNDGGQGQHWFLGLNKVTS